MSTTHGIQLSSASFTIAQLEQEFDNLGCIGGGGEGVIYEVQSKKTFALKALCNNFRITSDNKKVAHTISEILNNGISPHLTKIESLFSINCFLGAMHNPDEPSKFLSRNVGLKKEPFPRRAYLMEKMDGDLGQIFKNLNPDQSLAFDIQIASIRYILREKNVVSKESGKYRNILIKKLDANATFRGKPLQDFDFWRYVFGKHSFYLPKPQYVIKLGDYDPWVMSKEPLAYMAPEAYLQSCLNVSSLEPIVEKFSKPTDPHARIFDIFPLFTGALSAPPFDLSQFSLEQLYQLAHQKEEGMKDLYGEELCAALGPAFIEKIPQVSAEQLSLNSSNMWQEYVLTPDQMRGAILLRGIDRYNRPFIAIKCNFSYESQIIMTQVVELVYKSHPNNEAGKRGEKEENNYKTNLYNIGADKEEYLSVFPPLEPVDFKKLKDLVDGKLIQRPYYERKIYLRIATE